ISLYFLKRKWLDVRTARHISELKASSILHIWGTDIPLDVFVDSGNSCTEPLSDLPVHFVSLKAVETHMPEDLMKPLFEWNPNDSPSLSEFPEAYQKTIRLIRLMTIQGQS